MKEDNKLDTIINIQQKQQKDLDDLKHFFTEFTNQFSKFADRLLNLQERVVALEEKYQNQNKNIGLLNKKRQKCDNICPSIAPLVKSWEFQNLYTIQILFPLALSIIIPIIITLLINYLT